MSALQESNRHSLAERGDDCYETPLVAVEALMRVERLPRVIWEPACGPGAIVRVLRHAGHIVHASDLVDYGCPDRQARIDFLFERQAPASVEAIVTNPPYKIVEAFVAHALELCPRVMMLLRLNFLEARRPTGVLDRPGFARVHIFRRRLPMMHRKDWKGRRIDKGRCSFAWFVWDRNHKGLAELHRI
jgi:hypothetical protein